MLQINLGYHILSNLCHFTISVEGTYQDHSMKVNLSIFCEKCIRIMNSKNSSQSGQTWGASKKSVGMLIMGGALISKDKRHVFISISFT